MSPVYSHSGHRVSRLLQTWLGAWLQSCRAPSPSHLRTAQVALLPWPCPGCGPPLPAASTLLGDLPSALAPSHRPFAEPSLPVPRAPDPRPHLMCSPGDALMAGGGSAATRGEDGEEPGLRAHLPEPVRPSTWSPHRCRARGKRGTRGLVRVSLSHSGAGVSIFNKTQEREARACFLWVRSSRVHER